MKKLILLTITLVTATLYVIAQNTDIATQDFNVDIHEIIPTENQDFNIIYNNSVSSRGAIDPELADTLEGTMEAYFDQLGVKGLSVAVNLEGDIWTGTQGINTGIEPVTDNLLFAIGSVSKTLTSACILDMYEDGLLDLDDPIHLYLPDFDNVDSMITIRQMLNHTSGIYNYTNYPSFGDSIFTDPERLWTPLEIMTNFVSTPDFPAGTNWNYSNTNYLLSGLIIESISGNNYHVEVRNRLLDPLGLTSISLYPQEPLSADYANIWIDINGNNQPVDYYAAGGSLDGFFSAAWAAGAYVGTPAEMTQWVRALYNGDILEQSTIAELQTVFPFGASTGYVGYGLGVLELITDCADESAWGHGGDIIYSSQDYYYPQDEISIAVHCNDDAVNSNFLTGLVEDLHCTIINFTPTNTVSLNPKTIDFQSFPNPFSDQIEIKYQLEESSKIKIKVLNIYGKHIATLANKQQGQGNYNLSWSTSNKGMYLINVEVDGQSFSHKVLSF